MKVRIDTGAQAVQVVTTGVFATDGSSFDGSVLTIPTIAPGAESSTRIEKDTTATPTGFFLMRASLESSRPKETPGLEYNNRAESWSWVEVHGGLQSTNRSSVSVSASVDNLRPALNGQTAFEVAVKNSGSTTSNDKGELSKEDVQVKITLTPGLSFASSSMTDTTISGNTATWRVGDLPSAQDATRTKTLSVPVNLSGSAPLARRCLTAEVVQVTPPDDEEEPGIGIYDDVATVCLGDGPLELLGAWPRLGPDWKISLFDFFPCIGVTTYPCNTDDTLELVTSVVLHVPQSQLTQRRTGLGSPCHVRPYRRYVFAAGIGDHPCR